MTFLLLVLAAGVLSAGLYFGLQVMEKNVQTTPKNQDNCREGLIKQASGQEIPTPEGEQYTPKQARRLPNTGGRLPDYDVYLMSKREWLFYFVLAAIFCFFVAYVFYRSIFLAFLVTPLAAFYPRLKTKEIIAKRKNELAMQFKEALYALSSSLTAGRSVEEAFKEAIKDLSLIYPDPETNILQELSYIVRRMEMNETIEDALADLAGRAHLEELDSFVDVFVISKRTGGNIMEIIKNTSAIIGDKLQIKQEIDTLLAERRFERKILNIMPIMMILVLSWSTGDYMAPVFETIAGRFAMTAAVFLLGVAFFISGKIMKIEV